jgi:hypothetical protein
VLLHTLADLLARLLRRPLINLGLDRDVDDLAIDLLVDRVRDTLQ